MVTLDEAHAWQPHTSGTTELYVLPGGHFYLVNCWPRIADLVRKKVRELASPRS
jgi:pyochelin biosynthetic protein PchC